ncbi:response regulator transcription factor [Alteromonas antoniana]|uniref:response regulator transcription factor n=1 Tax=Alteromonas antoniana TaxID=2803813 RepID=UPI001C48229D|nr:response regulator transcription factor [Alteromonas antoniana]
MHILLVEDDPQVLETVCDYLVLKGHVVDCAYNGKWAITFLEQARFDLIILDVMMPRLSGTETAKAIRQQLHLTTPIIFLTARDSLEDKLAGFAAGGDDYLTKPFALPELEVRIDAIKKRCNGTAQNAVIHLGSLRYYVDEEYAETDSERFSLPVTQHQILKLLLSASPNFVSKDSLINTIWAENVPDSDAFRSHLYNLRKTLKRHAANVEIITEVGRGYRIVESSA